MSSRTKANIIMGAIAVSIIATLTIGTWDRWMNKLGREYSGERAYHVRQYSGGALIGEWRFRGVVDNQEGSDGYFFVVNGTRVEVSGDCIIESTE